MRCEEGRGVREGKREGGIRGGEGRMRALACTGQPKHCTLSLNTKCGVLRLLYSVLSILPQVAPHDDPPSHSCPPLPSAHRLGIAILHDLVGTDVEAEVGGGSESGGEGDKVRAWECVVVGGKQSSLAARNGEGQAQSHPISGGWPDGASCPPSPPNHLIV